MSYDLKYSNIYYIKSQNVLILLIEIYQWHLPLKIIHKYIKKKPVIALYLMSSKYQLLL